jgi:hypothetical protein
MPVWNKDGQDSAVEQALCYKIFLKIRLAGASGSGKRP